MSKPPSIDWTDDAVSRLTEMWVEGVSTAEIGRCMGISKNAVVGKAHRLELEGRPSPIVRSGIGAHPKTKAVRASAVKLAHMDIPAVTMPTERASISGRISPVNKRGVNGDAVRGPTLSTTPAAIPPVRLGRVRECCWPIGEPGTKAFRMCDDPSKPGKPYCPSHCDLAYVRIREHQPAIAIDPLQARGFSR